MIEERACEMECLREQNHGQEDMVASNFVTRQRGGRTSDEAKLSIFRIVRHERGGITTTRAWASFGLCPILPLF
jgi:hypothetical protein